MLSTPEALRIDKNWVALIFFSAGAGFILYARPALSGLASPAM